MTVIGFGNEDDICLSDWLRARIKQSGKTPSRLAKEAGISRHVLYRFENEQRDLSLESIDKLLPVLDRSIKDRMRKQRDQAAGVIGFEGKIREAVLRLRKERKELESVQKALGQAMNVIEQILEVYVDIGEGDEFDLGSLQRYADPSDGPGADHQQS